MKKLALEFAKTYASESNAEKAVQKWAEGQDVEGLVYYILPTLVKEKVRFGVVFTGASAIDKQVYFSWNVIA
jgi:hypothetical protein